jgi:membrane-bound ClpP family serine protease
MLSATWFEEIANAADPKKRENLFIVLTTTGGVIEVAERIVNIARHHYPDGVHFIVPNFAFSAGTVLCMSGNSILMDYYSVTWAN